MKPVEIPSSQQTYAKEATGPNKVPNSGATTQVNSRKVKKLLAMNVKQ